MSRANKPISPTPEFYDEKIVGITGGLTIREHFAGLFTAAIISGPASREQVPMSEWFDAPEQAVKLADALIAELAKPADEPDLASYRIRVARSVVSAASGLPFTSDEQVPIQIGSGELRQLVLIALEHVQP